jgi:hypothetical protein
VRLSLCAKRTSVAADVADTVDEVEVVEATTMVEAAEATTTAEDEVATITAADEAATTTAEVVEVMTMVAAAEATITTAAAGTTETTAATEANRTSLLRSPTHGHHHPEAQTSCPRRHLAGFPRRSTGDTRALQAMEAHPVHHPRSVPVG